MRRYSKRRDVVSFIVSAGLHVVLVLSLALIPKESRQSYETVDIDVTSKPKRAIEPEPEEEETPEPEPEPEPEPKKPKPRIARRPEPKPEVVEPPPLAPPEEEKVPEKAEEAPPVFDLGDNTFATGEGQGASWSMRRSEGNTKFAALAKKEQPSVRGTRPKGDKKGKPGGTGTVYAPVPVRDLSQRPRPKNGSIAVPPYPSEARREGIEGKVVLQVFIDKKGTVRKARIMQDPGGGLGRVAQSWIKKQKWTTPLDKRGKPVDTVITYQFHFVLDG